MIVILINHGDAILRGHILVVRLLRMVLTTTVSYVVSTASSVRALRNARRTLGRPPAQESDGEAQ